jgi:hypothetical protein
VVVVVVVVVVVLNRTRLQTKALKQLFTRCCEQMQAALATRKASAAHLANASDE